MANATQKNQNPHPGVTVRAIILGLLLIPVNTYFIMANHLKFWSTLPTTMSLIYNVIITLMVLIPFNLLLNRFLPRFALRQGELLTVFRDAVALFGDRGARYDANRYPDDNRCFLVCDP